MRSSSRRRGRNANLLPYNPIAGASLLGTSLNETITIGSAYSFHPIDLKGGSDTLVLGGVWYTDLTRSTSRTSSSSRPPGGIENVTLQNAVNGMDIDLGSGTDTLNLSGAGNVATVHNVETLNAFGSANDTITFFKDASVNQSINLGLGTNVLNLAGSDGNFSMYAVRRQRLHRQRPDHAVEREPQRAQHAGRHDVRSRRRDLRSVAPQQPGRTGVNVVKVVNIENVFGDLDEADQITVLGNSLASTTVTAGAGPDQITLSSGIEQVRFINTGDSSYDLPFGGQRDIVTGFNADQDKFMFDHIPGTNAANFNFLLVNFGGQDVILVDIDGGGAVNPMAPGGYSGYEMAIGVSGLTGTLGLDDFVVLV
jgi:hypothetical protein